MENCNLRVLGIKSELETALAYVKDDFASKVAQQECQEVKTLIAAQTGTLADEVLLKGLTCVGGLNTIGYDRDWLFRYKGRGYVMSDLGNQRLAYRCTIEEFVLALGLNQENVA